MSQFGLYLLEVSLPEGKGMQVRNAPKPFNVGITMESMLSDLAYLKGCLADGHVYDLKRRIRIVVRQKNKDWLENSISPILKDISGKEPKILRTSDGIYMIYVYIHKENITNEYINILLMPLSEIEFSEMSDKICFLTGFFDAEGSIYKNKTHESDTRVIMYQKDRRVLDYIKTILDELEIKSKMYGPYKNGQNFIYRLIVFTEKNSEKFLKIIKPRNKVKFNMV